MRKTGEQLTREGVVRRPTEPLAGKVVRAGEGRVGTYKAGDRMLLRDHGDEPSRQITELVPRIDVVVDAGEACLGTSFGHASHVLRPPSRFEQRDVEPTVGEETLRLTCEIRQVVAGESTGAVQAEADLRSHRVKPS